MSKPAAKTTEAKKRMDETQPIERVAVFGVRQLKDEHGRTMSGWVPFQCMVPVDVLEETCVKLGPAEAKALSIAWCEQHMIDWGRR